MLTQNDLKRRRTAPQQFKQSSRKGKQAWRKNVDISEVETGLEHLRDEQLTGYGDEKHNLAAF